MSRAFIKEDIDPVDRPRGARSASGLPPGAVNYMTPDGAQKLRARLEQLRLSAGKEAPESQRLEQTLLDARIIESSPAGDEVSFGAVVTVEDAQGRQETFRIVGADEVELDPRNVSWVSPIGKVLLSARLGHRVTLPGESDPVRTVTRIESVPSGVQ